MTVAEIKEYIDRAIDTAFAQKIAIDTAEILKKALIDTKYMLDELEPVTAKFVDEETINKIAREQAKLELHTENNEIYYTCSKCGTITYNPLDNYCSSCGARMEVEDDTTPTNV